MPVMYEIDYRHVFRISPNPTALLTPGLVLLDANDEFMEAVGRMRRDLVGQYAFEAFPKRPENTRAGQLTILEEALASRERESITLTRYDVEAPGKPGVFEERYWSAVVTPLLGNDGDVEMLELSAREVTQVISQYQALQAQLG